MPVLDADEQGNVLLGWYDRRDSNDQGSINVDFRPYVAYVSSSGSMMLGPGAASTVTSRPSPFVNNTWVQRYFIGDYHEIWRHNYPDGSRWNDAWIACPINTNGDTHVTDAK